MTIEAIVRNLTSDPEKALALLEYSYGNMFDYIVKSMTDEGVSRYTAQELTLKSYLRELEAKLDKA